MAKIKVNFSPLNIFTFFLPFLAFLGAITAVVSFFIFPPSLSSAKILAANITDGTFQPDKDFAFFNNQPVAALSQPLPETDLLKKVLSAVDEEIEERWIEIDLTEQKLYAHQGERIVFQFPISSGKWGRTPTGDFRIWAKLKYTLMHGGSQVLGTYYYLPNVPYTQYFHHGYGLHGTYWHNNFGHPMSHGCINLYTPDAETLFYWTSPAVSSESWVSYPTQDSLGTRVMIRGEAPWD
jgi:lipoprotein-anchoring transpeptidase ErfK/SrfK